MKPLPSAPQGRSSSGRELRALRDRQAASDASLDRSIAPIGGGAARRLVQIINNGSMPTSGDHYFAAVPLDVGGVEKEGGAATSSAGSAIMYVDVLGTMAPVAGDQLTAYAVGGRWVAEHGGAGNTLLCCQVKCSPCNVPKKDLQLAYTNPILGNGIVTLVYNISSGTWTSTCANGLLFELLCSGGSLEFRVIYFTTGSCPTGTQQYCSNARTSPFGLTLASYDCQPFSLTFTDTSASCPVVASAGYTQFVVTDPSPVTTPPGLMCQAVTVLVCGGAAVANAVVTIYTSEGGSFVAGGTTNANGVFYAWWQGSPGSYYLTVTATGQPSFAAAVKMVCSGGTVVQLVVPGYQVCCAGCSIPPLTLTDKNGSYPLNYDYLSNTWGTGFVPAPDVSTVKILNPALSVCDQFGCHACDAPSTGTTTVQYVMTCNGDGTYTISRTFYPQQYGTGGGCPTGYTIVCLTSPCGPIAGQAYVDVGSYYSQASYTTCYPQQSSFGTVTATCYPFSLSGSLTYNGGGIGDPVGGTVTVEPT